LSLPVRHLDRPQRQRRFSGDLPSELHGENDPGAAGRLGRVDLGQCEAQRALLVIGRVARHEVGPQKVAGRHLDTILVRVRIHHLDTLG
jgi:hypothetical protein